MRLVMNMRLIPVFLALLLPVVSATAEPGTLPLTSTLFPHGVHPYAVYDAWRYHPGDDPACAAPEWDDSAWEFRSTRYQIADARQGRQAPVCWYRLRLAVDSSLAGRAVFLIVDQQGALELYLDGRLIYSLGTVGSVDREHIYLRESSEPVRLDLEPGRTHLLAARFSNHQSRRTEAMGYPLGFRVDLMPGQTHTLTTPIGKDLMAVGWSLVAGLSLALAVLHLVIYWYYRAEKGNLYFAAFASSITFLAVAILFGRILGTQDLDTAWWFSGVIRALLMATVLLGMHFMHSIRGFRHPRHDRIFPLVLAAGMLTAAFAPQNVVYLLMAVVTVEIVRTLWLAIRGRVERIWIIGLGFSFMIAAVLVHVGIPLGWITLHTWQHYPPILAQLAITLSMSAYLGGRFANTNRQLAVKIAEAQASREALAESELRYRSMFENALAGVGIVDDSGSLVFANERYLEMTGYPPGEVVGQDVRKRIAPEYLDEVNRRFSRILQGEVLKDAHEFDIIHADGGRRTVQVCANAYRTDAGAVYTIIHIMDVTENREADRKRREAQQLAERTARLASMGVMAGGITHEINQPLNAIMLHAETLQFMAKAGKLDQTAPVLEALDHIVLGAERISEIIRHMRSFWVTPGRPESAVVELNDPVRHGLELTEQKIRSHAIRLELEWSADPLPVRADSLQLEQIAINLITNAVSALDKVKRPDKQVTIRTRREAGQAVLEVEDNGVGLPPEGERIFDPFFSTDKEQGGTGLGLAVVKMFVDKFKGAVKAHNNAAGGAVFTVRLPLAEG